MHSQPAWPRISLPVCMILHAQVTHWHSRRRAWAQPSCAQTRSTSAAAVAVAAGVAATFAALPPRIGTAIRAEGRRSFSVGDTAVRVAAVLAGLFSFVCEAGATRLVLTSTDVREESRCSSFRGSWPWCFTAGDTARVAAEVLFGSAATAVVPTFSSGAEFSVAFAVAARCIALAFLRRSSCISACILRPSSSCNSSVLIPLG